MKKIVVTLLSTLYILSVQSQEPKAADPRDYLDSIKVEMQKQWPGNRTINLVFHGHSVPAGYFKTPIVNTLDAYPNLVLQKLKEVYPYAVINVIVTAIGGENSVSGKKRFYSDVMVHKPDVLFIDYCLNDRGPGLEKAYDSWESMIRTAIEEGTKVVLLTPSPDQKVDILDKESILDQHADQVRKLAEKFGTGLIDSYSLFREKVKEGENIKDYMSQVNHPNERGHRLIAAEIMKFFE